MAFCIKCGNEITGDMKFCIKCGNPINSMEIPSSDDMAKIRSGSGEDKSVARSLSHVEMAAQMAADTSSNISFNVTSQYMPQSAQQYVQQPVQQPAPQVVIYSQVDEREESMKEMEKMITYFSKKSYLYTDFDSALYELEKYNRSGKRTALLVWGIILICLSLFIGPYACSDSGNIGVFFGAFALIGFPGIIMICGYSTRLRKIEESIYYYQQELEEKKEEITKYYRAYGSCRLGIEYTYPDTLERIYNVLRLGRASKISEAVNVLINDEHLTNIADYAAQTAAYSRSAATASKISAVANVANFFYNLSR